MSSPIQGRCLFSSLGPLSLAAPDVRSPGTSAVGGLLSQSTLLLRLFLRSSALYLSVPCLLRIFVWDQLQCQMHTQYSELRKILVSLWRSLAQSVSLGASGRLREHWAHGRKGKKRNGPLGIVARSVLIRETLPSSASILSYLPPILSASCAFRVCLSYDVFEKAVLWSFHPLSIFSSVLSLGRFGSTVAPAGFFVVFPDNRQAWLDSPERKERDSSTTQSH